MGDKSLQFITSIPWDVRGGSGCYVGTSTLAESLRRFGIDVELIRPNVITPFFTTTRLLFNESLRWRQFNGAATIGVDADRTGKQYTEGLDPDEVIRLGDKVLPDDQDPVLQRAFRWLSNAKS